ncbi:MAG: zf-HC2 domain-containing protein [Acidobacteriota bacterium]
MNCTQAEQLIPLDAGGDLQPPESDSLRQHIETCAHCQQITEEFAASQVWLSEFAAPSFDPKFDEAVFADLRASVRREIEQTELARERGRWFELLLPQWSPRFAVASAVMFLILAGGLVISWHKTPSPEVVVKDRSPKIDVHQPSPTSQREVKVEDQANAGHPRHSHTNRHTQRPRQSVTDDLEPTALTAQFTPNIEPAVEPARNSDLAKAEPEMLRIELQTSDPNIRIIWFAPKSDNSPTDKTK